MRLSQRRFANKTLFELEPDSVTYTVKDTNGSRSFTFDYQDFKPGTGTLEEKSAWWRNAGLLWVVIGIVQIGLGYAETGALRGSFWLLLGAACLAVHHFGSARYSVHDTDQGKLFIIKDRKHDAILDELQSRKRTRLRDLHGEIELSNGPEREIAKFKWLADEGAITPKERDEKVAAIMTTSKLVMADDRDLTVN